MRNVICQQNAKEHATLSAKARVDHGVEVETKEEHVNRAADRGCCVSSCSDSSVSERDAREHRKALFEKLMLGKTPQFNREMFYGSRVKILRVMEGEIAPEYPHKCGLLSSHPQTSVHAISKKMFVGLWLNLKHAFRVSVRVLKKVTALSDHLEPLLKHPFAKSAGIVDHSQITERLTDVAQQPESGISKSVDGREVTISEPKLNCGVDLTAGSVEFGNGDAHCDSSISSPNVLAHTQEGRERGPDNTNK